jgi:hypothetical protein
VEPALRHDGVTLTSPSSSPSLSLWLTAKAKARRAGHGLAVAARPVAPSTSRPSTYPALPTAIRSRRRDPRGSPNPSRLKGIHFPVHTPARRRRRRSGGRRRHWWPPVGTPSAAKNGVARGRRRSRRRQARLPPRRRIAVVFLRVDEPHHLSSPMPALWPVDTKVRTTFPPALCGTPRPSSRGGTRHSHRATAPPPLVMPAIEPGWDDFLAGAATFANTRAVCLPSLAPWPSCATLSWPPM